MLERLEMKVEEEKGSLRITVPTFRQDLRLDYDIARRLRGCTGTTTSQKPLCPASWVLGTKTRKEE